MKVFRAHVLEHLGKYKTSKLNISNPGYYREKIYPHILPKGHESQNILAPYSGHLKTSQYLANIKLHTNFLHLNSSQAMCINFFYPLILSKKLELITSILGIEGNVDYDSVKFEKESIVEQNSERKTNFDFYLKTYKGIQIFFEIKYTEDGFGKATNDKGHLDKYNRTYKDALDKSVWIEKPFKDMARFFKHYQIMRNLLAIDDNSYVVFIYPKSNVAISKAAAKAKTSIVTPAGKKHLINKTWDTLVNQLLQTKGLGNGLTQYYDGDFRDKYLK